MSNEIMEAPKQAITAARKRFELTAARSGLDWEAESLYALQACRRNNALAKTAKMNPWSLTMAMINVSAIGITLNPARQLAYLVPRDGEVLLDISYRGLIQIGVDEGAIKWAKAEIVREKDDFTYHGPAREPEHRFNPFDPDRGQIVGCYCVAGMPDGGVLVEAMPIVEVWKIRDCSILYARKKSGPWVDFEEEMIKKTVIKRASKTWPGSGRLAEAIYYLNKEAGEGLPEIEDDPPASGQVVIPRDDEIPERVREYTEKVCSRAAGNGLWNNAREVLEQRFKGAVQVWALSRLAQAEAECRKAS